MTADTFFDDGPAKDAAGEVRGNGVPVPVTAAVARVIAEQALDRGASTCVLFADPEGHLTRLVRVGQAPQNGWTRASLVAAVRRATAKQPEPRHQTDAYTPTVEIADFVRARDPVCTFPGCAVPASRCDLDHTIPHPRGPTSVQNLDPDRAGATATRPPPSGTAARSPTAQAPSPPTNGPHHSAPARSSSSNPCPGDGVRFRHAGFTIRALAPETFEDFAALLERNGGMYASCWCTKFHPDCAEKGQSYEGNRALKQRHVAEGTAHAALVYDGGRAVAWAQFGSPEELPSVQHRKEYLAMTEVLPDFRVTCIQVERRRAAVWSRATRTSPAGSGRRTPCSSTTAPAPSTSARA